MEEESKNLPIHIEQVGNGFIVRPGRALHDIDRGVSVSVKEQHVFESLSGLSNFLKNHFDHRNENVIHD